MVRALAALLALSSAVACAAPEPVSGAEVWLPEGHPLAAAQAAWGLPLEAPVEVVEYPADAIGAACGHPELSPLGCRLSLDAIAVSDDLEGDRRQEVLIHELGHVLAGGGHLALPGCPTDGSPGQHVMCAFGAASPTLTPEDFDFVLGTAPRHQGYR